MLEQLEHEYYQERDPEIQKRLLAIILLLEGRDKDDIADASNTSHSKILYWSILYAIYGIEGLRHKKNPILFEDEAIELVEDIKTKGYTIQDLLWFLYNDDCSYTPRGFIYRLKTTGFIRNFSMV